MVICQPNRVIAEFTDTQKFLRPGELLPDLGIHSQIPWIEPGVQIFRGFQCPYTVGFAAIGALYVIQSKIRLGEVMREYKPAQLVNCSMIFHHKCRSQ